jgi:hypothetical protein
MQAFSKGENMVSSLWPLARRAKGGGASLSKITFSPQTLRTQRRNFSFGGEIPPNEKLPVLFGQSS